jgi:5-methylcytosine-specific restriction protein A
MAVFDYEVGALYNRLRDIHEVHGGQRQGGISTPARSPVVIIFTGEAGAAHGYHDFWDDSGVFHYFGEGQVGDMTLSKGNRAILRHQQDGKHLLLFQMMGAGKPYRYLGEFVSEGYYEQDAVVDTRGGLRKALVFRLLPKSPTFGVEEQREIYSTDDTSAQRLTEVRTKQSLFRRRLIGVEKECRLTGVRDLRFLRASHIKPWADCTTGDERVDGNNGLLLTPTADHLFDNGWISFENSGRLLRSVELPSEVMDRIALNLRPRSVGTFNDAQCQYLDHHRDVIFGRRYALDPNPREALNRSLQDVGRHADGTSLTSTARQLSETRPK